MTGNFKKYFKDYDFILFFILFILERGREGEREEEKLNVWLPLMHPLPGTWPTTQACAPIGNQTNDLLVPRPALNSLNHTRELEIFQGSKFQKE